MYDTEGFILSVDLETDFKMLLRIPSKVFVVKDKCLGVHCTERDFTALKVSSGVCLVQEKKTRQPNRSEGKKITLLRECSKTERRLKDQFDP